MILTLSSESSLSKANFRPFSSLAEGANRLSGVSGADGDGARVSIS